MQGKPNEQEFLKKVTESQGIVHKVCAMYCDEEEDRKDLFQEILIQLWKSYETFRGDSKFSTWMYRVSLNVAISQFRKTSRNKEDAKLPDSFDQIGKTSDEQELTHEKNLLHDAIKTLSDVEKAIIMLHLEETANEEIAEIVGISQNYVRVKMTRIRTKLKEIVNPD